MTLVETTLQITMVSLVLGLALITTCAPGLAAQNTAGLVGVGTQRLFDYAGDIGLSIVRAHVTSAHVGGFSTTVHAPLLGDVDLTLQDVYLQHLNATDATAATTPQPDGAVCLDLRNFSVHVRCPLSFRRRAWPHISGHATAYVNAYGGHATLCGRMLNNDGRPCLHLTSDADVTFDDLDVRIADNKAAFLLNIVLLVAHQDVETRIQQEVHGAHHLVSAISVDVAQVQRQVTVQVPTLGNQLLQGLPVQADVLGLPLNISMQARNISGNCVIARKSAW